MTNKLTGQIHPDIIRLYRTGVRLGFAAGVIAGGIIGVIIGLLCKVTIRN